MLKHPFMQNEKDASNPYFISSISRVFMQLSLLVVILDIGLLIPKRSGNLPVIDGVKGLGGGRSIAKMISKPCTAYVETSSSLIV